MHVATVISQPVYLSHVSATICLFVAADMALAVLLLEATVDAASAHEHSQHLYHRTHVWCPFAWLHEPG